MVQSDGSAAEDGGMEGTGGADSGDSGLPQGLLQHAHSFAAQVVGDF